MTEDDLDIVDPSTAVEMFVADRQSELAASTLESYQRRLSLFVRWCESEEIESLSELTPRHLHEFRVWRQQGVRSDQIAPDTLRASLVTLRVLLRWAAGINAVDPNLPELVVIPDKAAKRSKDEMLEPERAEQLLKYMRKYEWASAPHVIIELLTIGIRVGTLRALDVEDYNSEEQFLKIRHRPETETPLKNQRDAERLIGLEKQKCRVLDDWIEDTRPDVKDQYGRTPLIVTDRGRRSLNSLRRLTYYWTTPCRVTDCPHGEDPSDCEWNSWRGASNCPSSRSTHPIRRGMITHHLREGVPVHAVSDKLNVSPEILDEHYNQMTERESMEARREYFESK